MSLHKSVTINILKKFSIVELQSLKRFVLFSTEDKNKNLISAFDFLMQNAPDFNDKECTKENFSKNVFKKKLNEKLDKEINRLMSELKDEVEKYIVYNCSTKDRTQSNIALAAWYKSTNLTQQFHKVMQNIEIDILDKHKGEQRELYWKYLEQKIDFNVAFANRAQSYLLHKKLSEHLKNSLTIEFIISKIGTLNVNRILNERAEEYISENGIKKDFLDIDFCKEVEFYEKQLSFIQKPNFVLYNYLKNQIINDDLLISDVERVRCIIILSNSIKRIIEIKSPEEDHLIFSQERLKIEERLNLTGISSGTFHDYLISLIDCKMYENAKIFLHQYNKPITGILDKNNLISYYLGLINYRNKSPDEALKILNNCYAEIDLYRIELPMLRLKIAYDLKEPILFNSYLNTFRKFISTKGNKQFGKMYVLHSLATAKYLHKLIIVRAKEKEKLNTLKKKALADNDLYAKKFILNKIEEKLQEK